MRWREGVRNMATAPWAASRQRIGALVWRQFRQTLTWIGPSLIQLVRPVGYLLLSVGLGAAMGPLVYRGQTVPYLDFLVPGLLAALAFDAFADALFRAASEKQWGVFRVATLHGAGPEKYLVSHMLYGYVWYVLRSLTLLAVAWALGARLGWTLLPAVLVWSVPGVALWAAVGTAVGVSIDSYNLRDTLASLLSIPVTFASSVFYDPAHAPAPLRLVATLNPLSLLANSMRALTLTGEASWRSAAAILLVLAVALAVGRAVVQRTPLAPRDR